MNCFVISLKYSPAFWAESQGIATGFAQRGFSVTYLWSEGYRWMGQPAWGNVRYLTKSRNGREVLVDTLRFAAKGWLRFRRLFTSATPHLLFFVNTHPLNPAVALLAKLTHRRALVAMQIHEPYEERKELHGGLLKRFSIGLVELVHRLSLKFTDVVVLPSRNAMNVFRRHYRFKGEAIIGTQLFADMPGCDRLSRKYIAFLGHAKKMKGIDIFFDLVRESCRRRLDLQFLIVTRSDISEYLSRLSDEERKILKVVNRSNISDEEMRNAAGESIAVLTLFETIMQSGIVPVAFMNGTPVIATDIAGLTEFVHHKKNGYIVPVKPTLEQVFEAIDFVRRNFDELSARARRDFEEIYHEKNWVKYYNCILRMVEQRNQKQ